MKKFLGVLLILFGFYILMLNPDYSIEREAFDNSKMELYSSAYSFINSIDKAECFVDNVYAKTRHSSAGSMDSFYYLQIAKQFTKLKFYHGNSSFDWKDNWICYLLGEYIWSDFNSIVLPSEIIKHSAAMCSQQTMVFLELMRRKGFNYRIVYLQDEKERSGHFCCEIFQGGSWHFFDVNGEPDWSKLRRGSLNQSIASTIKNGELPRIYDSSYSSYKKLANSQLIVRYSKVNEEVGRKMKVFQWVSKYLSILFPILLGMFLWKK